MENKETIEIIKCKQEYISLADSLTYHFIPLETTEKCLIGSISDIQIKNNYIYILEGKESEDLFVFNLEGKFITTVGKKGSGPEEYIKISDFDIDVDNNLLIISDKHRERILFYDLSSYTFMHSINTDFYYSKFIHLPNNNFLFFDCNGFQNPKDFNDDDSYYIQTTDSMLTPRSVCYKSDFITPYTHMVKPGKSLLYKQKEEIYVYHHLFPFIWQYRNEQITQKYLIQLDGYIFPDPDYLKGEASISGKDRDYANALNGSNFITGYRVDECSDLICLSIQKNKMPIQAVYNKKQKKGYLFSLKDYYRSMNLGMLMFPAGSTDDSIIGVIQMNEDVKQVKEYMPLYQIMKDRSLDDNPVLCLYTWK